MNHEHPFAQYVRILGKGRRGSRSLTYAEALEAMGMILDGKTEDVQLGAFLMLLRVKEESGEELAGFAQAARNHITRNIHSSITPDIDWSSYAGKRRHLPWYLLAVFCLADNGYKIFMHGAEGHTEGRIYTQSTLKTLGFLSASNWQEAEQHMQSQGFCYLPMEFMSPELHRIIELRNTFGLRSPVHSFSRMLNPLNAPCVAQGIFHPGYGSSHQLSANLLHYPRASIIKGEGGEIERNPDAPSIMQHCFNGELIEETWPSMFERRHVKPESLDLNNLRALWQDDAFDEYARAAVIGTLAFIARLMGKAETQQDCINIAENWWQQRNPERLK
ncbi:MAG: glycosyl transferase family protein [Oceanospirillaceae bacterium]|nr:glycosyl transferase family protein [Oceanospirillaceae bacterium]MCP5334066.1 glycosyl transferase family protein [Oceanospirillaceae bacterium]